MASRGAGSSEAGREGEDAPTIAEGRASAALRASPPSRESSPPSRASTQSGSGSVPTEGGSSSRSLVTARETLHAQEVERTRAFLRVAIAIALAQAAVLVLVPGDRIARAVLLVALVLVFGSASWLGVRLRSSDDAYTTPRVLAVAYTTIVAVFAAVYYYGVFSPAAVIVPLGLQYFCTGQNARACLVVYLTCAVAYAALAALTIIGALPDVGLVPASYLPPFERVVMASVVELVFGAVYVLARSTRRATLEAIERHDVVVRSLAQRDALLREARHELVQAMRVGGAGRFSGEVVGSFRLGGLIGRGAMGEVYEALRLDTNEEAAVKLVHPELLADRDVVERFIREAEITSSLSVANVVRVLEAAPSDAPIPYLAMERLHGEDLASILRQKRRLGVRRTVAMLRQIAVGIDAAHAAGVVHRDLKPRNVFCARERGGPRGREREVWKVLDFGVSKLDSGDGTLTRGHLVGTPSYMAPEQARAEPVGPRADVFALGVLVYRALTGAPPFSADTDVEVLFRVSRAMPVRPSELARLPAQVDFALAIALAKRPEDRYRTAGAFAEALDAAARGALDPALADRASALLDALPWGASGAT